MDLNAPRVLTVMSAGANGAYTHNGPICPNCGTPYVAWAHSNGDHGTTHPVCPALSYEGRHRR